jgi:uncharacterized RmlC-like cupin family protein
MVSSSERNWRDHGVKIIASAELDLNTAQTPGMTRAAAITHARTGATKLWAGTVTIHPDAKTRPHHHGELESVIYVVSGNARMRWGESLEYVAEAGPAILSLCRPSCRIRRSMPAPPSLCFACWFEAIKNPSSSIWI